MTDILTDLSVDSLARSNEANLYASSPFSYDLPQSEVYKGADISWCITGIPLLPCNIAFKARLRPEQVDSTIDLLVEKAVARNVSLRWVIGEDTEPADLGAHLESHGFTTSGPGPLMAIDLLSMKKDAHVPSNLNIVEVRDRAAFETWCHLAAQGFGIPPEREPALSRWFTIAMDLKLPMKFYLAFQNGEPVATSQLFLAEGVAGIYYVTTVPKARNQGIGFAVTLRPLQAALEMGYRVGTLQASKLGEPVYRRMGFEICGIMTAYHWRPTPSVA
jgi:GNAT superfamily N-acetyltransferase